LPGVLGLEGPLSLRRGRGKEQGGGDPTEQK